MVPGLTGSVLWFVPGHAQEHNLSISGGFKDTKYYVGGGLTDIKGVAINDNFRRFSSRINVETKIFKWLSIGTRTQLNFDDASGAEADFRLHLKQILLDSL